MLELWPEGSGGGIQVMIEKCKLEVSKSSPKSNWCIQGTKSSWVTLREESFGSLRWQSKLVVG